MADLTYIPPSQGLQRYWLLDLDLGGTLYRLSTDDITAPDLDGVEQQYTGLLEPISVMDSLPWYGDGLSPRTADLRLHLGDLVDIPNAVANGLDLGAGSAKLRLFVAGQSAGTVLIDGRVP